MWPSGTVENRQIGKMRMWKEPLDGAPKTQDAKSYTFGYWDSDPSRRPRS